MKTTALRLPPFLIAAFLAVPAAARSVSLEEHKALVSRSKVWRPVDPASLDILAGPAGEDARKPGAEFTCTFEELDPANPLQGHTPKFRCRPSGEKPVKVKYDSATSRKAFSEPAATRLFWALGFYADRSYSVKTVCANCPADPWRSYDTPRATRVFDPTSISRHLAGEPVEVSPREAWSLDELDDVDAQAGGATQAEVDALKLLLVFVHHGDNNPTQQRLLCEPDDKDCRRPVMYVTDLGGTFGGHDYIPSYRAWAKKASLWKDKAKCVADFSDGTDPHFVDPKISEAGRRLLADQMARLSDKQVRDIFAAGRFDLLGKLDYPVVGKDGRPHPATLDDWAALLKKKRQELVDTRCPE